MAISGSRSGCMTRSRTWSLQRYPYTLALTLAALLIGIAVSVPAGVFSALHRGRWQDRVLGVVSLGGLSFPELRAGTHPDPDLFDPPRLAAGLGRARIRAGDFLLYLMLPAVTLGLGSLPC